MLFTVFVVVVILSLIIKINLLLKYRLIISLTVGERTKPAGDQIMFFPIVQQQHFNKKAKQQDLFDIIVLTAL